MEESRANIERWELEPASGDFSPVVDLRPLIPEPLPVRLVAIEDVELPAASGSERDLEAFYVSLLGFERDLGVIDSLVLRAENLQLGFSMMEPPSRRDSMRALGIEVSSLGDTERKLVDAEIPYTRQSGIMPGQETLSLQDPAGNWISLSEIQLIR